MGTTRAKTARAKKTRKVGKKHLRKLLLEGAASRPLKKAARRYLAGLREGILSSTAGAHLAGVGPDELKLLVRATVQARRDLEAMATRLDATSRHLVILFEKLDQLNKQRGSRKPRRYVLLEIADKRFARIVRTGKAIPWPEMRAYLRDRLAGKNPPRPRARKLATAKKPARYRLDDLLKEVRKQNRHPEIDFGPPVGREIL